MPLTLRALWPTTRLNKDIIHQNLVLGALSCLTPLLTRLIGSQSLNTQIKSTGLEPSESLPNSQQSFTNNSTNSQLSQNRPSSSGAHESSQGIMTPSTTLSSASSPERNTMNEANTYTPDHNPKPHRPLHPLHSPLAVQSDPRGGYTSAPKRTASGEIKSPVYSLHTSPIDSTPNRHSRNSSLTSRASQIGEVRLSDLWRSL